MDTIEQRLKDLGLTLPPPTSGLGAYRPVLVHGGLGYVSGQLPLHEGTLPYTGKVGSDLPIDEARIASELCILNVLTQIKEACGGNWAHFSHILKITGYVNSAPTFCEQHFVMDGASRLLVSILQEKGEHARAAVGVASLPLDAAVEIEAIFAFT